LRGGLNGLDGHDVPFSILRSGIALSSKGGGADRNEGTVGGIPFKEDQNEPVRAAAIRWEGPPERARMLRGKRTLRRGGHARHCETARNRERVFTGNYGQWFGSGRSAVWVNEAERIADRDNARLWTTTGHDTAGRDDLPLVVGRSWPLIAARGAGSRGSARIRLSVAVPGRRVGGAAGSVDWGREAYRFRGRRLTPFSEGPLR
jgi:hypothetical protein